VPTATVRLRMQTSCFWSRGGANGPVEAAYKAIDLITKIPGASGVTNPRGDGWKDAMGEVTLAVEMDGQRCGRPRQLDGCDRGQWSAPTSTPSTRSWPVRRADRDGTGRI